MTWTTYLKNKVLDHLYDDAAFPAPDVYLGISTTAPAADGTGVTEPAGNNYSRVQINPADMAAAAAASKTNSSAILIPVPSGPWGTGTHLVGYDHPTAGNLLFYIDSADVVIDTGDELKVPIGALVHTL